jgi:2-iminobutanoate/2-iminopropanoate deaminase
MSHHRHAVSADGAPAAVGPYSHAVRSGGFLFCSGQVPLDPATGELVPGGIGDQTRRCLQNLQAVCEAGGTTLADAVRVGIYVTDMGTFKDVNEAYAEFFAGDEPPARSTIGVAALPLGAQVEIDAVVALPD